MSSLPVHVGLDYHSTGVQVCVMELDGTVVLNRHVANDSVAIVAAVGRRSGQVFAAIEACSGASDLAEELATRHGWSVDLAHPGYVARIKQSPDKTDFSDAKLLADLSRVGYLPKVWLAPAKLRDLRTLVRRRHQLAAERRNVKLRVSAVLREHRVFTDIRRWTVAWIRWVLREAELPEHARWVVHDLIQDFYSLKERIAELERKLETLLGDDPLVRKMRETPGIGLISSVTMRVEIGRFDRFRTGKQLSRFCGLSPRNASSGHRVADAGLIKAGNPELRRVLIEAAHQLRFRCVKYKDLADRMRRQGKKSNVITAAIANRYVRWLYHRMLELTPEEDALAVAK